MSRAGSLTPSEKVVWAWRFPRSQGISGAPAGRWADRDRSSNQGAGAGRLAGGGPSQGTEKPSANQPPTSFHPVPDGAPTGGFGDAPPAIPMRPGEGGGSRPRGS